jgi:hypothetical protein
MLSHWVMLVGLGVLLLLDVSTTDVSVVVFVAVELSESRLSMALLISFFAFLLASFFVKFFKSLNCACAGPAAPANKTAANTECKTVFCVDLFIILPLSAVRPNRMQPL